ncbi:MAG: HAMP domain-containing sensor histidine kinase [Sedimenticolaceae bacterium]
MVWAIAWCRPMPYRNSLRFRIFITFLGAGLLLGPLLALAFLTVAQELEERTVARVLVEQLRRVMAAPDKVSLVSHPSSPNLRIFGDIEPGNVPAELEGKTGIYDIEPGSRLKYEGPLSSVSVVKPDNRGKNWLVAVGRQGEATFVAAGDQTALESRESLIKWVVAAGTFLSVCASLWAGYLFTRRLIKPLQHLAAATSSGNGGESVTINPEDYPPDEIGQLATALKHDRERRTEALIREKAFSAEVAHELRNPLAIIQSSMEIIERDSSLAPLSGRALDRALAATREMNDTLSSLLLLGRERTSPVPYPAVDIAAVLRATIDKNSEQSAEMIGWEQGASSPKLHAPEAAIRMIADNLIRNAVQNTPSGQVKVSLMADRVIIRDTGIGIPPSELEAIRRNGIRGSNALGSGSGLGLALVERLCKAFGWNLDIQSQVGEGTTVTWHFA